MTRDDLPVLPQQSGCYLFHGEDDAVLYVGKAVDLRSRVASYFGRGVGEKTRMMVRRARRVEFIVTDSEVDALILEANLIKRYKPHFNVLLKDDKAYPFLKLTDETYPILIFTRRVVQDGGRYFGPYPNAGVVRRVQELIASVFPLRQNSGVPMRKREKPCLRYHMGKCLAPCVDATDPETYGRVVRQVVAFLEGRVDETAGMLEREMRAAAERRDFELAATYRDRLDALRRLTGYDSNVSRTGAADLDFLGLARGGNYAMVQLFQMRGGRVVGRDKRFLTNAADAGNGEILERFLADYYGQATHVPPLVLLPDHDLDTAPWARLLAQRAGRKVELRRPRRGDKVELVAMADRNAATGLEAEIARLEKRGDAPGVRELQSLAGLDDPPWRIEGFDVSNLMGSHTVASIVAFEGGRAKRSDYRRMRIRGLDHADDYASMHQAVLRRFTGRLADGLAPPDLLLIDGGRGQIAAARRALDEAGMDVPVLGLAKREETILPEAGDPILVPQTHPALRLLMNVRDEAHRTAVGYNRQRRTRSSTRSLLDDVPGIGPKRRDALLRHFSSIEQIRDAPLEQLAALPGLGPAAAEAVKRHFAEQADAEREAGIEAGIGAGLETAERTAPADAEAPPGGSAGG